MKRVGKGQGLMQGNDPDRDECVPVTIVIPCFNNDPEHLAQAVQSAVTQDHPQVDVVVVDDGSTRPDTVAALDGLQGVQLLRQANLGAAAARNAGIRAARTEVIIPLDADDWIDPQYATEATATLAADGVTVAYPRLEAFGDARYELGLRGEIALSDFMRTSAIPVASAFRKSAWELCGGYDALLLDGHEDHEFWVRLLAVNGGIASPVPTSVFHYRVRPASRSKERPFSEDLARTRDRIVANSTAETMEQLLRASWVYMDKQQTQFAGVLGDPLYLRPQLSAFRRLLRGLVPAEWLPCFRRIASHNRDGR